MKKLLFLLAIVSMVSFSLSSCEGNYEEPEDEGVIIEYEEGDMNVLMDGEGNGGVSVDYEEGLV